MKRRYINVSISSIVAMMVYAISPVTLAETKLDMLDANANALFSDQDIISVDNRRYRRHHRRYNRHNRRYNRHNRRYNRYDRRYRRHHRRNYYDDRYNTY